MNDFRKLAFWRRHGINFLLVTLSLTTLAVAYLVRTNAKDALLSAKGLYQQQQTLNTEAEQAAEVLQKYLPLYHRFQEQGLIGPPQRLQWLETLTAVVNTYSVPSVTFNLTPTVIASEVNTTYLSDTVAIKVTPMRLDFSLLHEGDFYRLLEAVQTQAKGIFSTQSCEIRRSEDGSAGLKGQCELLWYSLADISSAWEVPNDKPLP